jgi:hypothetical protein
MPMNATVLKIAENRGENRLRTDKPFALSRPQRGRIEGLVARPTLRYAAARLLRANGSFGMPKIRGTDLSTFKAVTLNAYERL